jgi:hypothetical protein
MEYWSLRDSFYPRLQYPSLQHSDTLSAQLFMRGFA